jgi:hypothetical protein
LHESVLSRTFVPSDQTHKYSFKIRPSNPVPWCIRAPFMPHLLQIRTVHVHCFMTHGKINTFCVLQICNGISWFIYGWTNGWSLNLYFQLSNFQR